MKINQLVPAVVFTLFGMASTAAYAQSSIYIVPDKKNKAVPYEAVKVLRNGKILDVRKDKFQCDDEFYFVKQAKFSAVKIAFSKDGKQQIIELNSKNHKFTPSCNRSLSLWEKFKQAFSFSQRIQTVSMSAVNRNCSNCLPITTQKFFNHSDNKRLEYLLEGKKPLRLFWYGGDAPFRLEVKRKDTNETIFSKDNIHFFKRSGNTVTGYTEALLPALDWSPGHYFIYLYNDSPVPLPESDFGQAFLKLTLEVLPVSAAPASYRALLTKNADNDRLMESLLKDNENKWGFEVFQYME